MQQTENYQLGLWELSDQVTHEAFNENTVKIDSALAELAEGIEETTATIAASMPRVAVGTYKGSGRCSSNYPNRLTFTFKPKFFMVWGYNGWYFRAVEGQNLKIYDGNSSGGTVYTMTNTVWGDNYISWYFTYQSNDSYGIGQMNDANTTYQYIAIG